MDNYEIVFTKLAELTAEDEPVTRQEATPREMDEIEALRRFSAEIQDPEPCSFTTT